MGLCFPKHFIFLFGPMFSPLHTKLGLPQLLSIGVIHCICGWPLDLVRTHFLHCSHGGERIASHNVIQDAFPPLQMKHGFIFHKSKFMSFQHLPFNLFIVLSIDNICTLGQCVHCQSHNPNFTCYFTSQGGRDGGDFSK